MQTALIDVLRVHYAISQEDAQVIGSYFKPHSFKESDVLLESGHVARHLFFICDGVLRFMHQNEKGNEVTYFFLKDDQFCTVLNSFNDNVPSLSSVVAACDSDVLSISKTSLQALYAQLPWLKNIIEHIQQQTMVNKILLQNSYQGLDSTERYENFLKRQPEIADRVQLADIASYLGITPQSLSRIRKNMRVAE